MKIGIDARMYGPKQTGIGNYIKYLIDYLARIDERNMYYIFLRKEAYINYKVPNTRYHKVLADVPWYSLAEQLRFVRLLYTHQLDLVHFPHFNVPLLYRRPFVVTIHDLTPQVFPGEKVGKSWLRQQGYRLVLRNALRQAKAIITPSVFTKHDIMAHFSLKEANMRVIYEGIPLPPPAKALVTPPTPYILYVGVWRSHKNLEGLLRAFGILVRQGLPHKLVLVGEPDIYFKKMKNLWESLGLTRHIIPVGFQQDERLEAWYRDADLLVLPSFSEGFGLTPLIALSFGVPVAVSNIPVLREILGEMAWYFNPYDPHDIAATIKKALGQGKQALSQGRQRVILERYRWDEMARKTLALYEFALTSGL